MPNPSWVTAEVIARRGPNARYSMFTIDGNNCVANEVDKVILACLLGKVTRIDLPTAIRRALGRISSLGYPEIFDTEPEWAIVDEFNERICTPLLWSPISRDDI